MVVHIIHRLGMGGLENGLVNLINHMPPERYRHAIICLTDFTDFRNRIRRPDVPVFALHKREGKDFRIYRRLWRILKEFRPVIVHTRNIGTLEYLIVAAAAGVPGRIHGEHGRDVYDLDGRNRKYNLLRKTIRPFASRYTAVSKDLAQWLERTIGVRTEKVTNIYNGVDLVRFRPPNGVRHAVGPEGFAPAGTFVVGTVGRMEAVKDQLTLVRAFIHLIDSDPNARAKLRLVLIGDGPLRKAAGSLLREARAHDISWLPGERDDVPEIMRSLDLFVLPSLAEGISNTILEAMASGLPVVATRVGGNPELVVEGVTGMLVPPADPAAQAEVIRGYVVNPNNLTRHGRAGRTRAEKHFSIEAMVDGYIGVYEAVLRDRQRSDMVAAH
jgi:sugar transferase (PEP-CTERM/EpsH1 system associated)